MTAPDHYFALLPCAGSGQRAGTVQPKQYQPLAGLPLVLHTLRALAGVSCRCRCRGAVLPSRRVVRFRRRPRARVPFRFSASSVVAVFRRVVAAAGRRHRMLLSSPPFLVVALAASVNTAVAADDDDAGAPPPRPLCRPLLSE